MQNIWEMETLHLLKMLLTVNHTGSNVTIIM